MDNEALIIRDQLISAVIIVKIHVDNNWAIKNKARKLIVNLRNYLKGLKDMKYTQHSLDKVEKILDEAHYIIRYERGTFQSGYCILEARKVVVLNKFLQTEGRINTLFDIIPQLNITADLLTPETRKVYEEVIARYHEEEK